MKKYAKSVKNVPERFLFDVLNTALVFFVIGMLIVIIQWIVNVFSGQVLVTPLAFNIGSWPIYWYGIFFALAFLFGFIIVIKQARKSGRDLDQTIGILFWTVIFGLIGARLFFVVLNWNYYGADPLQMLNIWQGGLSIYGAILGGLVFMTIYCAKKKIRALPILDIFTYALMLGQVIGRWGNLFNQEYFGRPTELIKTYISPINRPWEYRNQSFFQPLFFYESVFCLVLFIVLALLRKAGKIADGFIFLYYLLFYSAFRFFIEFLSFDPKIAANLNLAQLISAIVFIISIIVILYKNTSKEKNAKIRKR